MKKLGRFVQIIIGLAAALLSLSIVLHGIANWSHSGALGLLGALIPLLVAALPIGLLEWQIRSIAKAGKRIRAFVEECAKSVFDAPGAVRTGYDLSATATPFVTLMGSEGDNGAAFTTDGTYRGTSISVASHASVVGRQIGEFHHTYSHVVVDVLGLERPFRIARERAGVKIAKAVGAMKDVNVGDKAFDDTFLIASDEDFAKDVLDESIRERLLKLQSQVSLVSSETGPGGMSLQLSKRGLALRWPGDIEPGLAITIRDLLLDMRERMLSHENRRAVRVGEAGTGYRIADDAAPKEQEEAAEEEARARTVE